MSAAEEMELALAEWVERAVNAYLALDPATLARLEALTGRVVAIELVGLARTLYLMPHAEGLQVMTHYAGAPDARLRGTPLALAKLSLGAGGADAASKGMFSGDVTIEGDVELGQRFKRALDGIDIDWEELVSRVTGDVLAHRLGRTVRELRAWGARAAEHLGLNLAEYLQYESADLAERYELEVFLGEVDTVRNDTERLEARVSRLTDRLERSQR